VYTGTYAHPIPLWKAEANQACHHEEVPEKKPEEYLAPEEDWFALGQKKKRKKKELVG
jgi:hypothetical protein